MSTFALLHWAMDLRGLTPLDKLAAIYFAAMAGSDGKTARMDVAIYDMADWCGCKKEEAVMALDSLRGAGLVSREIDHWIYRAELNIAQEPRDQVVDKKISEATMHIYVVSTSTGVKVGITRNREARFKSFRTASPETLEIHFTARGPQRVIRWAEARCHGDLRPYHIHGEWFSCRPDIAVGVVRAALEEGGVDVP